VTDGQTDGQNYDPQDHASIAASRGKNCIKRNKIMLFQEKIPAKPMGFTLLKA